MYDTRRKDYIQYCSTTHHKTPNTTKRGVERGSRRHILKRKKVRFSRTYLTVSDRPGTELGSTVASVDSKLRAGHKSRGVTGEEDNCTLHAHKRQSSSSCHRTSITHIQILWLSHLSMCLVRSAQKEYINHHTRPIGVRLSHFLWHIT